MTAAETTVRVETDLPADAPPALEAVHAEAALAAVRAQTAATTTVSDAVKDTDGQYSSKRIAAFMALAMFLALCVADTVHNGGQPSQMVMDNLMYIVLGGLSLGTVEQFRRKI